MFRFFRQSSAAYAFLLATLVGCSGGATPTTPGGHGQQPSPGSSTPGNVSAVISVPYAKNTAASKRKPAFISPSSASIFVNVNGTQATAQNLSTSGPNCTQPFGGGLLCVITFVAPVSTTDTIQFQLWDAPVATVTGGGGNLLSENTSTYVIGEGLQTLHVDMHGVVRSVAVQLQYSYVPLSQSKLATPLPISVSVLGYDADNNLINEGEYDSPITLTDRDTSGITYLASTSISSVVNPATTLYYAGGFIKATGIDATSASIPPANAQAAESPAGLSFDCMGGEGTLSAGLPRGNIASPSTALLPALQVDFSPPASSLTKTERSPHTRPRPSFTFASANGVYWDGNVLSMCSTATYGVGGCVLTQMAPGECIQMPLGWAANETPITWQVGGLTYGLQVTFNPAVTPPYPSGSTCVTVYAPPSAGGVGGTFDIDGAIPWTHGTLLPVSVLATGWGVYSVLNVPVSDYYTQYADC